LFLDASACPVIRDAADKIGSNDLRPVHEPFGIVVINPQNNSLHQTIRSEFGLGVKEISKVGRESIVLAHPIGLDVLEDVIRVRAESILGNDRSTGDATVAKDFVEAVSRVKLLLEPVIQVKRYELARELVVFDRVTGNAPLTYRSTRLVFENRHVRQTQIQLAQVQSNHPYCPKLLTK